MSADWWSNTSILSGFETATPFHSVGLNEVEWAYVAEPSDVVVVNTSSFRLTVMINTKEQQDYGLGIPISKVVILRGVPADSKFSCVSGQGDAPIDRITSGFALIFKAGVIPLIDGENIETVALEKGRPV